MLLRYENPKLRWFCWNFTLVWSCYVSIWIIKESMMLRKKEKGQRCQTVKKSWQRLCQRHFTVAPRLTNRRFFQLYLIYMSEDLDPTCYVFPVFFFVWICVFILWHHSPRLNFAMETQVKHSMSDLSPLASNIMGKKNIPPTLLKWCRNSSDLSDNRTFLMNVRQKMLECRTKCPTEIIKKLSIWWMKRSGT